MSEKNPQRPAKREDRPVTYKIALYYAYALAACFMFYGGYKLVLSFLDRKYDDIAAPLVFLCIGMVLLAPAIAYRDVKPWGYWCLIGINVVAAANAAIDYGYYENIIVLVFSLAALSMLLAPPTKQYLSQHR